MQTLISVFEDRSAARRAMDRLIDEGFSRDDVHLQEAGVRPVSASGQRHAQGEGTLTGSDAGDKALGEQTMDTAEREVAVDESVIERLGDFFVGLFGGDRGPAHAGRYSKAIGAGRSVLLVDTQNDQEADLAAMILHQMGATDVDDQQEDEPDDVRRPRAGVALYNRDRQPRLRDLVDHRHVRNESIMADRSAQAQVTRDREERAIASGRRNEDKDRPV